MSNTSNQTLKFTIDKYEDIYKFQELTLKEDEHVVGIRSVTFLIAEKGSVEPPVEVTPDLDSQADVHIDEWTGELPSGKVKFTYSIHKTGNIKVGLVKEGDKFVKSIITAKVVADVEKAPIVGEDGEVIRPDLREHAVKETSATSAMMGREVRTIYHMGQDTTLFVVGLDENLVDQEINLSDVWVKDNLKDLTKEEISLLRGDDTAKISLARAEKSQDALENIYRSIHGVPTVVAKINDRTYYLPIINHDGSVPQASLISSLNFEYWNDVRQMLPHELREIEKGDDPQHLIVSIHTALNRQMDWAFANAQ